MKELVLFSLFIFIMNLDLYSDLESGLIADNSRVASNSVFVQAGKALLHLYRKGHEDALAYLLGPTIYVVHSDMLDSDEALQFSEKEEPKVMHVDEVLRSGHPDRDDITADCLRAFSNRFIG
jgi:hypothetical protein